MNKVILLGRLTKDPELRYTQNNTPVASFTLAVDRRFKQKGQPEADFIPIVAWQSTAEFVSKYFTKGLRVAISGRIQTRNWEDQGVKHYVTEVIAEEVGFADGKKERPKATQEVQSAAAPAAAPTTSKSLTGKPPWMQ